MFPAKGLDLQAILDGLGEGVLIFDSANRLVLDNVAARTIFGNDLKLIRAEGWPAAAVLFNTRLGKDDPTIESVRANALASARPVRFHTYRMGEYIPCWAAAIHGEGGDVYTMITVEMPDWTALTELMDKFLQETREAVETTQGHAELIGQSLKRVKPNETIEQVSKRVGGFTKLISTHMHRTYLLMDFMERLGDVRTGAVREKAREAKKRIKLRDFVEDFLEELDGSRLVDPDTDAQDFRARIKATIPDAIAVEATPHYLSRILRDIVRNAIMYSMRATPIVIDARSEEGSALLTVVDEGYGIRATESERVWLPFQRARQPQIIGEFGYGLSLFLCKHEVEAMNGRIWFDSDEGVGTTFTLKLPLWRDDVTAAPSSGLSSSSES